MAELGHLAYVREGVTGGGKLGTSVHPLSQGGNVWLERYLEIISTGRQLCQDSCNTVLRREM